MRAGLLVFVVKATVEEALVVELAAVAAVAVEEALVVELAAVAGQRAWSA